MSRKKKSFTPPCDIDVSWWRTKFGLLPISGHGYWTFSFGGQFRQYYGEWEQTSAQACRDAEGAGTKAVKLEKFMESR